MRAKKRRPVPTRPSYHHGDLKAALLAAAGRLLEEEGAEAVSFRAIARDVGVSQTALAACTVDNKTGAKQSDAAWVATWALVHGLASLLIDGNLDSSGVGRLEDRVIGWYAALLFPGKKSRSVKASRKRRA